MADDERRAERKVLIGWWWEGTDKWWPAIFGEPPAVPSARWRKIVEVRDG